MMGTMETEVEVATGPRTWMGRGLSAMDEAREMRGTGEPSDSTSTIGAKGGAEITGTAFSVGGAEITGTAFSVGTVEATKAREDMEEVGDTEVLDSLGGMEATGDREAWVESSESLGEVCIGECTQTFLL